MSETSFRSQEGAGASSAPALSCLPPFARQAVNRGEKGSVLFYIFLAVGLLAALTYSFVNSSRDNTGAQNSFRVAEELYAQAQLIRASIIECAVAYPGGGGDLNADSVIDEDDNPNNPYPVNGSHPNNPHGVTDDFVSSITCTGAPDGEQNLFGANPGGKSRFLPPPPPGFENWVYHNNADGVSIVIYAPADSSATQALKKLRDKFAACETETDPGDDRFLRIWIVRNTAC